MAERGGKVDSRLLLVFAMIDEALRATKEAEDAWKAAMHELKLSLRQPSRPIAVC